MEACVATYPVIQLRFKVSSAFAAAAETMHFRMKCCQASNPLSPPSPPLAHTFLGQQRRRPSLYHDRRNMSEKSKKTVAALAAFADLLLLQTGTHTHTLVQLLHMLQESSSAKSFSKTEVQTTTFSWRNQTPQNNSKSRENLHGNSTKTWKQAKERRLKTNEESEMSKKQKHDRKFCTLQKLLKVRHWKLLKICTW